MTIFIVLLDAYILALLCDWFLDESPLSVHPRIRWALKRFTAPYLSWVRRTVNAKWNGKDTSRAMAALLLGLLRLALSMG